MKCCEIVLVSGHIIKYVAGENLTGIISENTESCLFPAFPGNVCANNHSLKNILNAKAKPTYLTDCKAYFQLHIEGKNKFLRVCLYLSLLVCNMRGLRKKY